MFLKSTINIKKLEDNFNFFKKDEIKKCIENGFMPIFTLKPYGYQNQGKIYFDLSEKKWIYKYGDQVPIYENKFYHKKILKKNDTIPIPGFMISQIPYIRSEYICYLKIGIIEDSSNEKPCMKIYIYNCEGNLIDSLVLKTNNFIYFIQYDKEHYYLNKCIEDFDNPFNILDDFFD